MAVLSDNLKESHFVRVLEAVKKRPGMFLSPVDVMSLRNFISGYSCSKLFSDEVLDVLSVGEPNFYDWMAAQEGVKLGPAMGWAEMLHEQFGEEAFMKFFDYLEKYLSK